jgi:glycosyltransferase involved in cell wall biosynthesis
VLEQVRRRWWKQAAWGAITLLQYYPYGFMQCASRVIRKTAAFVFRRVQNLAGVADNDAPQSAQMSPMFRSPQGIEAPLVSVVIPCHNYAHFLGEAIDSVLAQTWRDIEIIVVDDGSTDNTFEVASRYPSVRYIRQQNKGLSESRNTGLRHSAGNFLVFLDADDRLRPSALETGLRVLKMYPDCAFAAGHCDFIATDGSPLPSFSRPCNEFKDAYSATLMNNQIWNPACVVYRREVFESVSPFDSSVNAAADYDLYLRILRRYPVKYHPTVVAEYRQHTTNMSRDFALMLRTCMSVLHRQRKHIKGNQAYIEAYKTGIWSTQVYWGEPLIQELRSQVKRRHWRQVAYGLIVLLRDYPKGFIRCVFRGVQRTLVSLSQQIQKLAGRITGTGREVPPVGRVRFGSLRRLTPISRLWGCDRGLPVDRYYVEKFLTMQSQDIQGHIMEIGDDSYTRKFGESRVTASDVLHVLEGNPKATIVGDLTKADHIPSAAFDCIICTQTLQLIYDTRAALRTLYRILKPGGVLLATFPGISQTSQTDWGGHWCWNFTSLSAHRIFSEIFPAEQIRVQAYGNVFVAVAFLEGLAVAELREDELEYHDPDYQVLVTVRAVKSHCSRSSDET